MDTSIIAKVLGVAIGLYVISAVMPDALVSLAGANLTGVPDGVVTMLQIVIPLLGTIAIAFVFFRD